MSGSGHPTDARGRVLPDGSWPPGRTADGELERLRRFVNTTNLESGADHLADGAELAAWLGREGHPPFAPCTATDAAHLRRVREALRDLIDGAGAEPFAALVAGVGLRVRVTDHGTALDGRDGGVDGFVGWVAAVVHDAHGAGTWPRLKVCANRHCRWVTYDRSKNASSAWCSPAACGARAKARAYRARRKEVGRAP